MQWTSIRSTWIQSRYWRCLTTTRVREPMRGEHSRKCAYSLPTSQAYQAIWDSLIWRTVNRRPQSASANRTSTTLRAPVLPRPSMRSGMTNARAPSSTTSFSNTRGVPAYVIAKAYGFSGNSALAFDWLNRAFAAKAKLIDRCEIRTCLSRTAPRSTIPRVLRKMQLPE